MMLHAQFQHPLTGAQEFFKLEMRKQRGWRKRSATQRLVRLTKVPELFIVSRFRERRKTSAAVWLIDPTSPLIVWISLASVV